MVWNCIPKNKEKGLDKKVLFPKSPQPGSLHKGPQDAGLERDVDNRSRATFTLAWEESLTKQHVPRQDYRRQGGTLERRWKQHDSPLYVVTSPLIVNPLKTLVIE